jgi:hypothetical protein
MLSLLVAIATAPIADFCATTTTTHSWVPCMRREHHALLACGAGGGNENGWEEMVEMPTPCFVFAGDRLDVEARAVAVRRPLSHPSPFGLPRDE